MKLVISRRTFTKQSAKLAIGAKLLASDSASAIDQLADFKDLLTTYDLDALRSAVQDLDAAEALGKLYLRALAPEQYPGQPTRESNRQLAPAVTTTQPDAPRRQHMIQQITAMIRDDFANARDVSVGGWLFSLTECELCAHLYLTRQH